MVNIFVQIGIISFLFCLLDKFPGFMFIILYFNLCGILLYISFYFINTYIMLVLCARKFK